MRFGLSDETIATIHEILNRHPFVDQAIIYGSRAKGTHHRGSDIDLTLIGQHLLYEDLLQIMREFHDSAIPYIVDVSIYHYIEDMAVRDHIKRQGQVLYNRSQHFVAEEVGKHDAP